MNEQQRAAQRAREEAHFAGVEARKQAQSVKYKYVVAWHIYTQWSAWMIRQMVWKAVLADAPEDALYPTFMAPGGWRTLASQPETIRRELEIIIEQEGLQP